MKDAKSAYVLPEGSDYLIDRQSNNLIVHTTPQGHERVSQFLDFFDQPAIQVLIKTRFLSIELNKEQSLGLNLSSLANRTNADATKGAIRNPFHLYNVTGGTGLFTTAGTPGATVLNWVGSRTDPTYQLTLAALATSDKTRILSEPQVLAINNKEAVIDITTHFSYITDLRPVTTTTGVGNGTAFQTVSAFVPEFDEENIGFTLTVTPSVGRDLKTINLHLNPIIDSLAQGQNISQFQTFDITQTTNTSTPPTIQRPTIDQTSLETDVVMEDNGYVIIGGLIRNRAENQERRIPGLSRIPYLGEIFKSRDNTRNKSNLMVIVEANIISPTGRTYHTCPAADDVDIREGGSNHPPGQVSDARRGSYPLSGMPAPYESGKGSYAGTQVPFSKDPAQAYNQTRELNAARARIQIEPGEKLSTLSSRERMERLAAESRNIAAKPTLNGWAVAQEESTEAAPIAAKSDRTTGNQSADIIPLTK
jgi:type II secretory pathway component GspD/PulD (secretin)